VLAALSHRLVASRFQRHVLFLAATGCTIAFMGYYFGTFDQVIHIPFLKKDVFPSLYPGDPFFELSAQHYSYFWFFFRPFYGLEPDEKHWIDNILARYTNDPGPLIPILQDISDDRRYLPRAVLEYVSATLEIPLAEILRVASFYNAFSLEPVGRHIVEVCLGTACFVRGSGLLLERLEGEIGVRAGGTDTQGQFTLRTVRCIGCCALAPAMRIDGVTFGNVKLDRVVDILWQHA